MEFWGDTYLMFTLQFEDEDIESNRQMTWEMELYGIRNREAPSQPIIRIIALKARYFMFIHPTFTTYFLFGNVIFLCIFPYL